MNTFKPGHKEKARRLTFVLILCFHLARAPPPGPCKHSVTHDHLLTLRKLIQNQLLNGCSMKYAFIERQHLSDVCYVKAAIPQILDLIKTHFNYVPKSDNNRYVTSLENVIYNIYTHRCIPEINEEQEDNPEKFTKDYNTSPQESLEKVHNVLTMYMTLMMESRELIDWGCEDEYAVDLPESHDVYHHTQDEWLSTSESYAPTSKWTSPSPSELTTEAPERSSQPHSTTIATAWSSQSAGTGDDNTDVLDSKGQKGGTATASDPLTDPTLQPNRVRPVSWG
ncbi:macrophage colony-stimulating factor 1a [Clupea harengus]|uniref:Macrophage colony-stimulating factor 1a n=1 Tax=Clupea harengus TaxID=7950 RepID=A0A6P8FKJ8_CLUHA|nr:macrophage colony-stimulating factor 1a [Clupea harengus]